ncbi:MAG: AI-2E family transporter [Gammaproteobacteria bacterium]|nr:AI-2E family transporter [Gammaproteobacteria bacterium]MBV9697543.1 AI-2E family transporter [Gammaproteobacteria bacterium]
MRIPGRYPLIPPPSEQRRPPPTEAASASAKVARTLARPLWILAGCALVAALREGREMLIPIALAILFSLVLSGVVERLHRWRIPRSVSALVLLLLSAVVVVGIGQMLWAPAQQWVQNAPHVLRTIEHKVRPARSALARVNDIAERTAALAGNTPSDPHAGTAAPAVTAASPVNPVSVLTETGWVLGMVVTVMALTLLLLAAGPPTLARMTAAMAGNVHAVHVLHIIEAIRVEVGRYYSTLALINISLGTATAVAMWLLKMPNPLLWGTLACVLNFIPYLGSATTLTVLTVVALVTFSSVTHVLAVAATFLGLATIEGQIVEPIFFGRRLHLSPVIIFVALWLGGWLWGIAGIVMAMPVLVSAKVAATHSSGGSLLLRLLAPASVPPEPAAREPSATAAAAAAESSPARAASEQPQPRVGAVG